MSRQEIPQEPKAPWDFHLRCSPETVCWGYLDASVPPRLEVASGAVVRIDTVNGGEQQFAAGPRWRSPPEHVEIHRQVKDRIIPGHILTGPVAVERAAPGDVLQVDILDVALRANWAWTMVRPFGGALCCEGRPPALRHTLLEAPSGESAEGWGRPPWGGRLPLQPFFGVIGVAPPLAWGRQSSIPPRDDFGGNMDLKELVAGSTLYLPVQAPRALLFVGDGHARQGDGECCGTALETSLTGVFRLTLHPLASWSVPRALKRARAAEEGEGRALRRPRAETAETLITMAFHHSLDEAAKLAIEDMLDWLAEVHAPSMDRTDGYMFLSVAADVRVTQLVNFPTRGAHVVLKKAYLPDSRTRSDDNPA